MFDSNSNALNDGALENTHIIAKIFSYLNADELRRIRLINFDFNKIVTTHPNLFWAKNVLRVRIRSGNDDEKQLKKEWTLLRLHSLITVYGCPNFHFYKTDIMSPEAVKFFQSSARYQIKYLKLTRCTCSWDVFVHLLACISKTLEHLEVRDISKFANASSSDTSLIESRFIPRLVFPRLVTIILSGKSCKPSPNLSSKSSLSELELPKWLLQSILHGSFKLEKISLELNATSCQNFSRRICSIDPVKLLHVKIFEIHCTSGNRLEAKCLYEDDFVEKQYELLKQLFCLNMPNLQKLRISFQEVHNVKNEQLVETMTTSVSAFLESSSDTLQSIELINCPINNVFRIGINSFRNLCHVNTKGSFANRFDGEDNPIYEYSIMNRSIQERRRDVKINDSSGVAVIRTMSGNLQRLRDLTRVQVYQVLCLTVVFIGLVHTATKWALGSYIGEHVEILIYASIVLWITKGSEISEIWRAAADE